MATPFHKPQRTKIVCTLGPATESPEAIRALMRAGADFFRINLSHGTRESHAETIRRVREAAGDLNYNAGLLLDLRGARVEKVKGSKGSIRACASGLKSARV